MRKSACPILILLTGDLFVFTLLFSTVSFAATYYVNYDSGDDTRAGTSEAAAWQHAPGDPHAAGVADATALFPDVDFRLDLDRQPRPQGGGWDMGAYEFSDSQANTNTSRVQDSGSGGCFVLTMAP